MRVATSIFVVSILLSALVCDVAVARRSGGIGGSRRTSSSSSSSGTSWFGSKKSSSSSNKNPQSSYPKQTWSNTGTGTGTGTQFGGNKQGTNFGQAGSGGFANPSGAAGSFGGNRQGANVGQVGGGGFANPSGGAGTFGGSKQGTNVGQVGGGGFVNPSGGAGTFGGSKQGANVGQFGGGGFVNPSGGAGTFGGNKQGSYGGTGGSSIGGGGFANPGGNRGGYSGGGYSGGGYSNPNVGRSQGYYGAGGQSIFGSSRSNYNYQRSPFGGSSGSRGLAIGAGAGFIGGAVAGVAAVSMYHQYRQYQSLLYCHANPMCYGGYGGGYGGYGYGGRRILVNAEDCVGGCPNQAYCDYGVCRCRDGYEARYGSCFQKIEEFNGRQSDWDARLKSGFNPYHGCSQHKDCRDVDMNMVCKANKCACRDNMKWNDEVHECQIFVDVDCSDVDVNSTSSNNNNNGPVASALTDAANATLGGSEYDHEHNVTMEYEDGEEHNGTDHEEHEESPFDNLANVTSLTANETLADSELTKINPNTTSVKEIKATFCREIARTARVYAPPPVREPVNRNNDSAGGIGTGVTVILIIAALGVAGCIVYGVLKMFKGNNRPKERDYSEDDEPRNQNQMNPMAFSALQNEPPPYSNNDQGGYPQVPVPYPPGPDAPYMQGQGTFQPYPQGPGEVAPYPPQGAPYPPQGAPYQQPGAPYPPQSGPYPPQGAPYPPAQGAPYPPGPGAPYPPQSGPAPYPAYPPYS